MSFIIIFLGPCPVCRGRDPDRVPVRDILHVLCNTAQLHAWCTRSYLIESLTPCPRLTDSPTSHLVFNTLQRTPRSHAHEQAAWHSRTCAQDGDTHQQGPKNKGGPLLVRSLASPCRQNKAPLSWTQNRNWWRSIVARDILAEQHIRSNIYGEMKARWPLCPEAWSKRLTNSSVHLHPSTPLHS
jgi:hypothetical protein